MKHSFLTTIVSLLLLSLSGSRSQAGPGNVDLTFDPGSGIDGPVSSIAVQPDGKVIIGGGFRTVHGLARRRIARLNAEGTGDASFVPDPLVATEAPLNPKNPAVLLQADGKVLVTGDFLAADGTAVPRLVRLNTDGSLDSTFVAGVSGRVSAFALQADGKVVVVGVFTTTGSTVQVAARLNSNGTLDSGFTPATGVFISGAATLNSVAIQVDGKVLIGGIFRSINGTAREGIARLNANGSVDLTFVPASTSVVRRTVRSIAVQPDGRILFTGFSRLISDNSIEVAVRLNGNGSDDNTFNSAVVSTGAEALTLALQSDGKLLIAGGVADILRLNSSGTLDNSFICSTEGNGSPEALFLQADGKVMVGGSFNSVNGMNRKALARLDVNGGVDSSFDPRQGIISDPNGATIFALAAQADGKVVVGGIFEAVPGSGAFGGVVRLLENGSLDPGFNTGTGGDASIRALAMQPDGKILVGGGFTLFAGVPRNFIARLNPNGTVDPSFNPGIGPDDTVYAIAVQSDGKVIIGGWFTMVNNTLRNKIARLNSDGSLDDSFGTGTGGSGNVYAIALQPDGKILRGGDFLARLQTTGSLDPSFDPGTGFDRSIESIALQPDGKVVIGGYFTTVNGLTRTHLARMQSDGLLDASFTAGTLAGGDRDNGTSVNSLALQSDGKLLIGGSFNEIAGSSLNSIARLHPDGSVDSDFIRGAGVNAGLVYALALQTDAKLLVGGNFTAFDDQARWRVARVDVSTPINIPPVASITDPLDGATFPAPATITIKANASDSDGSVVSVVFRSGLAVIGTDMEAPFETTWNNVLPGSYVLTAEAVDNQDGKTRSSTVNVTVTNAAPTVTISSPVDGATFNAPANIVINVDAADSDGTIARVDVFAGETMIASDTSPSLAIAWDNVPIGSYALRASATDNLSASSSSQVVNVVVTAPLPPAAPTALVATASGKRIQLRWVDNATDETAYRIERSSKRKPFVEVGQVAAGVTEFVNRGLAGHKRYTYRVRAHSDAGDSVYSNEAKAKTH